MRRLAAASAVLLAAAPAAGAAEISVRSVSANMEEWIATDSDGLMRYRIARRDQDTYVVEAAQIVTDENSQTKKAH